MAKQTVNIGAAINDGSGDPARTAFNKLNQNNTELYDFIGGAANTTALPAALPVAKGGTGATTAAAARTNLGLGTAATATLTASNADNTSGRVLKVGDFGVGVRVSSTSSSLLSDAMTYSHFGQGNYFFAGYNHPYMSVVGARSFLIGAYNGDIRYVTKMETGEPTQAYTIRSTKNTTVDANGFIKNASPIVKLFADKIELNDEAQQQNIEFEKLGVGDYLIKSSSGFAQDGWYIETPKDANGNVLVAVVYGQLENGDISVKTYDYMLNNKGRIVADTETPLDIPESRWIDLRLQELPQPEIEVTDDTEQ